MEKLFSKEIKYKEVARAIYNKTKEGKLLWQYTKNISKFPGFFVTIELNNNIFRIELTHVGDLYGVRITEDDKSYLVFTMKRDFLFLAAERVAMQIDKRVDHVIQLLEQL